MSLILHVAQARSYFERALTLDPENVDAIVAAAYVDIRVAVTFFPPDRSTRLAAAKAVLNKAMSLAPEHPLVHCYIGAVLAFTNRPAEGISESEYALTLDRNLVSAHAIIGLAKLSLGRGEETESHVREALRLSPRDSNAFTFLVAAGISRLCVGQDEAAVTWLRKAIEANRNFPNAHFSLAAALAHLGRQEEARASVKAGLVLNPTYTIARDRAGAWGDNPTYLAQRERLYDGMRKAGVPEG